MRPARSMERRATDECNKALASRLLESAHLAPEGTSGRNAYAFPKKTAHFIPEDLRHIAKNPTTSAIIYHGLLDHGLSDSKPEDFLPVGTMRLARALVFGA